MDRAITPSRVWSRSYAREVARAIGSAGYWGHWHQLLAGLGWTSLPLLPWLRQPTLILSGDADPIVPPINAQIMHRLIPRSKMYIFRDGHPGLGTRAEELAGVIERFLSPGGDR